MKKSNIEITIVSPIQHQCPYKQYGLDDNVNDIHPSIIRDALAGGLDREMFPLLDSRTRYWRYYLLIGPQVQWRNYIGIGQKLYRIAKQNRNSETKRVTKGIGRKLVNKCTDERRQPKRKELKKIGKAFRQYYGSTVTAFWEKTKEKDYKSYGKFNEASKKLKKANDMVGFFNVDNMDYMQGEGFIRRSFHRIISSQNHEIERLLKRKGYDLWEAIASIRDSSIKNNETLRMILAWALLRILYGKEVFTDKSNEGVDNENDHIDEVLLRRIANKILRLIKHKDLWGKLDENIIRQIELHIKNALKNKIYMPPLPIPRLPVGQKRQRLFSDMRLSAFNDLLRQTDGDN